MDKSELRPFVVLGKNLRALRDQAKESLAEASGAVEIDVQELASYELGHSRPSQDVLLLLISHFGAKEEMAIKMWQMAGYSTNDIPAEATSADAGNKATDSSGPILFTDIVDVVVNKYGVVMNFLQNDIAAGEPKVVARVGMSREHAKSVLKVLNHTLTQTEKDSEDKN